VKEETGSEGEEVDREEGDKERGREPTPGDAVS
jgi:hypothetical protein